MKDQDQDWCSTGGHCLPRYSSSLVEISSALVECVVFDGKERRFGWEGMRKELVSCSWMGFASVVADCVLAA